MLVKYNINDTLIKYPGVFFKDILVSELNQTPFNVSLIRVIPKSSTKVHNHHDSEFITILSGKGEIRLNDVSYPLKAGDIFYIRPFSYHSIVNHDAEQELVFTTCWWVVPAQIKNIIEVDIKEKNILPENTVIISSFPTPNGPLHLGHLSGPFIAADMYARFLKQHKKSVSMTCGLDQSQTWCGIKPDEMHAYTAQIKKTLSEIKFDSDFLIEPISNKKYKQLTQTIFSDLLSSDVLFSKTCQVFICEETGRYLADSEIIGNCPHCQANIRGNNCEQCYSFVSDSEIVNPQSLDPNIRLGTIHKERIYFPLSQYQELLERVIYSSQLNSNLKQIGLSLLKKSLPDIPVSHYFPWGIPVTHENFTCQYISYYFEHVARLIYTLKHIGNDAGIMTNQIVRFFGIDNIFMYSLFFPALIHSYDPLLFSKIASNTNQYYLLNNMKFSTSKKNAIWADEFIAKFGSDLTRFYLAYSRPEDYQTNFSDEDFMDFCGTTKHKWSWLDDLAKDIRIKFNAKIPEAGSWDFCQKNYFSMLKQSVDKAFNYLLIDNFSTREYVHVLLEIANGAYRLRKKYICYSESNELQAYYRTAIALQVSAAHTLAIISWPVMPEFANKLYNSLGFRSAPIQNWKTLPQLLPPSQLTTLPNLALRV